MTDAKPMGACEFDELMMLAGDPDRVEVCTATYRATVEAMEQARRERDEARQSEKDTWANWESRVGALKEQLREAKADAARLREVLDTILSKMDDHSEATPIGYFAKDREAAAHEVLKGGG